MKISQEIISEFELNNKAETKLQSFFKNVPIKVGTDGSTTGTLKRKHLILNIPYDYDWLEALLHEMSHLAEIPDNRIFKDDFGMDSNKDYNAEKALDRELKAFAYESNLFKYLGYEFPDRTRTIMTSCDMTAFGLHALGKPRGIKNFQKYCLNKISKYMKIYTIRKFKSEWDRKSELIKQKLS